MSSPVLATEEPKLKEPTIYNRTFWVAYAANLCLVSANAMTLRFANFVEFLGGNNAQAGYIVSIGALGALVGRIFLGQIIDRSGVRVVWMFCSLLMFSGILGILYSPNLGPIIYVSRIAYAFGLAAMFTCSIVHIQNQAPIHRRTEIIGMLGSSGFLGLMVGSQCTAWILSIEGFESDFTQYVWMFGLCAGFAVLYLILVAILTHKSKHDKRTHTPALLPLLFQYGKFSTLLVAILMGTCVSVAFVFFPKFTDELNLRGMGIFFTGYAVSAFIIRLMTRNLSRMIGRHRLVEVGMVAFAISFCVLPYVTEEWHLLIPACLCGFAHALLFPSVVSLVSGTFPVEFRGTGTTIALGFIDMGMVISGPIIGILIDKWSFPIMFYVVAAFLVITIFGYRLTAGRSTDEDILLAGK